jgi:RHS repeat-associated protein
MVSYVNDTSSRRTRITFPDGYYFRYAYDSADSLLTLSRAVNASATDLVGQFAYDDLARRVSLTRNGVVTSYGYDSAQRLSSLSHDLSGSTEDVTFSFLYNAAGQIKRRTVSNPAYSWNGAYVVDRAYGANGLNQMTSAGSASISYSLRGNLASDGTSAYKYDLENRLRGTLAGASLVYDPLGRLYEATTAAGVVTRFLYDGVNIIGEYSSSNTILRRYVYGPGSDEPLVRYNGSSTTPEWLFADQQGSIIAATNSSGVALADSSANKEINTYDEYGIPGAGNKGLFQYTGQVWLADLGLYHYKARAYSPTLGRFLQTDPTGYDDGLNWYAYVGNDPLNNSDPAGTQAIYLGQTEQNITSSVSGGDSPAPGGGKSGKLPWPLTVKSSDPSGTVDDWLTYPMHTASLAMNEAVAGCLSGACEGVNLSSSLSRASAGARVGATVARAKLIETLAAKIVARNGANRFAWVEGSVTHVLDAGGAAHFEKSLGRWVSTPHIFESTAYRIPSGPMAGMMSSTKSAVRDASIGELLTAYWKLR